MGLNDEVRIKFSAESQAALAAIESIAASFDKIANKAEKSGTESSLSIGKVTGSIMGVSSALDIATKAVDLFVDANSRMHQKVREATNSVDEDFRRVAVQAGRLLPEDNEAIGAASNKYALTYHQAADAARKLISTGFTPDEVFKGGALDTALGTAVATNSDDTALTAGALSKALVAMGRDKTPANMKKLAIQFHSLFNGTDVEAPDIAEIASVAAADTAMGVASEDLLPAFAVLKRAQPGADSKTAMKNLVVNLATAGGSQEKVAALSSLHMTAKDVDFTNGDIEATFRRLKQGVDSVDAPTANIAMNELFGHRSITSAYVMMQNLDYLHSLKGPGDEAAFNRDVDFKTTGPAADARRSALENQRAYASRKDVGDKQLLREAIETSLVNQGDEGVSLKMHMTEFDVSSAMPWHTNRQAAELALSAAPRDLNDPNSQISQILAKMEGHLSEMAEAAKSPQSIEVKSGGEAYRAQVGAQRAGQ